MVPQKVNDALKTLCDYFGEEKLKHDKYLTDLFEQAKKSKSEFVFNYAEAMMHVNLQIKPTTKRLGYALANVKSPEPLSKENSDLLEKIKNEFDREGYIFRNTNYDECSNGYFFRRN
jgi:hypothetical protein